MKKTKSSKKIVLKITMSMTSTQQVVNKLVEIVEADPEVDDEEAQALSDAMDAEVRSRLFQRCKSKQHPHRFALFPKGWEADRCQEHGIFRTFSLCFSPLSMLFYPVPFFSLSITLQEKTIRVLLIP